jgi:hypothetical protein
VLHFNMKTIRGFRCIVHSLLHNKPASTELSPGNFCAQVHDKRYTLCDVHLGSAATIELLLSA